jgi:hypothetical protein
MGGFLPPGFWGGAFWESKTPQHHVEGASEKGPACEFALDYRSNVVREPKSLSLLKLALFLRRGRVLPRTRAVLPSGSATSCWPNARQVQQWKIQ